MSVASRFALPLTACALACPASAQTIANKDISAEAAMIIASTAIAECKSKGWNVSVAVVGRVGELIVPRQDQGSAQVTR